MTTFFRINSKVLSKNPTTINNSTTTIQKSERTMDGSLVIDIVANKDVVSVQWDFLSSDDMRKLKTEMSSGGFCTISYFDALTSELKNITAQPGDIKYAPYYDYINDCLMWKDVSISFTER